MAVSTSLIANNPLPKAESQKPMLKVSNLSKDFGSVQVLRNISFSFASGVSVAITGPSGSGKSTLLHIVGTLEKPTAGQVEINNTDPFTLSEPELARYRNAVIGFVFQEHHLLPQYSVLENVLVPTLAFKQQSDATQRAHELLKRVGLTHRISHRPAELSGGERQRVAIARALINQPRILLCDEPTGNLDTATSEIIANLLFELHRVEQNILIVVTHNLELASRFQQRLQLTDGTCSVNGNSES
jgi:lipoprotein-releasing system ATP-binding protein